MHSHAKVSAVPFGDTGDQVGAPGERYRRRKAVDYGDDLALQAERMQGFIDGPLSRPSRDTMICLPIAYRAGVISP